MTGSPISTRVLLLIEDNEADAELVSAYLSESMREQYEVHHVVSLKGALEALQSLAVDVILLDLRLPDSVASESVGKIRGEIGDVPILVLTGMSDEELALDCINAGAQDYLFKNELHPNALRRAIGYAITRKREAELRELRETMARYRSLASDAAETSVTAGVFGLGPVKARLPAEFDDCVGSYGRLLRTYVNQLLADAPKPRDSMELLVTRLGDLGAGPRDVIDVHTAALDEAAEEVNIKRHHSLIVEGRLFALEMMGLLVDYYRIGHRRRFQGTIP
ncbi:response regulator [Acuticoccus sp. M5D2P5]|uniref:response regulator n=1 Tax=Acuticoccus kalidii TaxID=2910977 RepID=UPI001F3C4017|nr:response regulator [Acuticoccus kalidii]MCF3933021.1 response regulator [Acuticoccus kalidii]